MIAAAVIVVQVVQVVREIRKKGKSKKSKGKVSAKLFHLFTLSLFHFSIMSKILYTLFAIGVIGTYSISTFMGWEFGSSGRNSFFGGVPFIGGGYRGGK